ncbi:hypothetical protein C7M84_015783, partial [Penaeus vannamei]
EGSNGVGAELAASPRRQVAGPSRARDPPSMVVQGDFRKVSGISTEIFRQIETVENDHDASTAAALEAVERRGEMVVRLLDPRTLSKGAYDQAKRFLALQTGRLRALLPGARARPARPFPRKAGAAPEALRTPSLSAVFAVAEYPRPVFCVATAADAEALSPASLDNSGGWAGRRESGPVTCGGDVTACDEARFIVGTLAVWRVLVAFPVPSPCCDASDIDSSTTARFVNHLRARTEGRRRRRFSKPRARRTEAAAARWFCPSEGNGEDFCALRALRHMEGLRPGAPPRTLRARARDEFALRVQAYDSDRVFNATPENRSRRVLGTGSALALLGMPSQGPVTGVAPSWGPRRVRPGPQVGGAIRSDTKLFPRRDDYELAASGRLPRPPASGSASGRFRAYGRRAMGPPSARHCDSRLLNQRPPPLFDRREQRDGPPTETLTADLAGRRLVTVRWRSACRDILSFTGRLRPRCPPFMGCAAA